MSDTPRFLMPVYGPAERGEFGEYPSHEAMLATDLQAFFGPLG
ncbi:MAG: hypothetical protein ACRDPG_12720 [Nocardioidaceae bacterium]